MPSRFIRSQLHGLLVALWLTLSIASVVMAAVNWQRLAQSMDAAEQQSRLNDAIGRIQLQLTEAVSAQRRFVLTGRPEDLEPHRRALEELPRELASLKDASGPTHPLRNEVFQLRILTERHVQHLRASIPSRERAGGDPARIPPAQRDVPDFPGEIGRLARQIRQDRSGGRDAATRDQLDRANLTSLVAGLVGVGAGLFSLYLARVGSGLERRGLVLSEAKQRAESSNREKSAFLANMSHEIRTPMNSILGFTDLLSLDPLNPRQKRHLHSIHTAAESLLQLINDVLDMSKIEAGAVELHPEPTDPRELAEFLQTVFAEQLAHKGLAWSCDIADSVPHSLMLDRTRLRQVLVNLVGNAVKFTERGGVRLRLLTDPEFSRSGRTTLLAEVEDTGMGIPPDRLDAIFKPFVQADGRRASELQGTGLGLAIVKRLTEMMGGSILVASIAGRGTTFQIRIPNVELCGTPSRTSRPAAVSIRLDALAPSRILVVDDHPMNRELVAALFEGSAHQLRFASDGTAALALAAEFRPDLVLLDLRMPGKDGRQVLAELRARPGWETIPVIAMTASGTALEELGPDSTFDGFLRKPFSRAALFEVLRRFLAAVPDGEGQRPSPPGHPTESDTCPQDWSLLLGPLRRIEASDWAAARDSGSFQEARALAQQLLELARSAGCGPLEHHARELLAAAEDYDPVKLEEELLRFPTLLRTLEPHPERTRS